MERPTRNFTAYLDLRFYIFQCLIFLVLNIQSLSRFSTEPSLWLDPTLPNCQYPPNQSILHPNVKFNASAMFVFKIRPQSIRSEYWMPKGKWIFNFLKWIGSNIFQFKPCLSNRIISNLRFCYLFNFLWSIHETGISFAQKTQQ